MTFMASFGTDEPDGSVPVLDLPVVFTLHSGLQALQSNWRFGTELNITKEA